MRTYFDNTIKIVKESIDSLDLPTFEKLVDAAVFTLKNNKKIIVSGLGKNVPICEKFVGTMLSLGLRSNFMHTNSAVHGDLGMIEDGDLLIILTKSGETNESIYLSKLVLNWNITKWLITFSHNSDCSKLIENVLEIKLQQEEDLWNILPNNSSIVYLIILQELAITLAKKMGIKLSQFKRNHPGGQIGEVLKNE